MNIFTATRRLAFVEKLFTAAGLDLAQFDASGDESALQAQLASLVPPAAPAPAAPAEEVARLHADLKQARADLVAAREQIARQEPLVTAQAYLVGALTSSGVEAAALQSAESATRAIEARISTRAAELTAAIGTRPVEGVPAAGPAFDVRAPAPAAPSGLARAQSAFAVQIAAR